MFSLVHKVIDQTGLQLEKWGIEPFGKHLPLLALIVSPFIYQFGRRIFRLGARGSLYPPGPPTLPILGNLLEFPRKYPQYKFGEWARQYGDVISVQILGQTIIVIHTPTLVKEIFDVRSLSNSNRPASTMVELLTPNNLNVGTAHYANDTWKAMRKPTQNLLTRESFKRFSKVQHAEATQMMINLLHDPEEWYMHAQRFTTSFTMSVCYGKRTPQSSSVDLVDFLHVHRRFMSILDFGTAPPVDIFPPLQYLPSFLAPWKHEAKEIKRLHHDLYTRLTDEVEARLDAGMGNGCFMEDAIKNKNNWGMKDKDHLLNLGGTILEGSDTTSASTQYLFLCAVAFPDKAAKVSEELDRVIGPNRVPTLGDIDDLPYTKAFTEECSRFLPVANLGLPHEMNKDEIVNGVLYPKGAVVFQNTWFIFHDERYFEKPFEFMPERFVKHPLGIRTDVPDDPARRENLLFGGGRRVCPGTLMANTNLQLVTAYTLWAFNVKPGLDPVTGKEVLPDVRHGFEPGITATPFPFKARITPRSKAHMETLQAEFQRTGEILAPYEREINDADRKYNATYRDI